MPVTVNYIGKHIESARRQEEGSDSDSPYFSAEQARQLKHIFSFLNEKDRDILYLIFVSKKKQRDVQRILGRSQPSLCYDIKRIRRRMRFISYLHSRFDIFMNFIRSEEERRLQIEAMKHPLPGSGAEQDYFSALELRVLTLMFYTSSFTLTSKIMGMSQVRVRYMYNRCLRRLEDKRMWEPYEIFLDIRSNLNIIKRVYRDFDKHRDAVLCL